MIQEELIQSVDVFSNLTSNVTLWKPLICIIFYSLHIQLPFRSLHIQILCGRDYTGGGVPRGENH